MPNKSTKELSNQEPSYHRWLLICQAWGGGASYRVIEALQKVKDQIRLSENGVPEPLVFRPLAHEDKFDFKMPIVSKKIPFKKSKEQKKKTAPEIEIEPYTLDDLLPDALGTRYLFDLGYLAEHHLTQIILPSMLQLMRQYAAMYYLGHPFEPELKIFPLADEVVRDFEENGYDFFFVKDKDILDFYTKTPSGAEPAAERVKKGAKNRSFQVAPADESVSTLRDFFDALPGISKKDGPESSAPDFSDELKTQMPDRAKKRVERRQQYGKIRRFLELFAPEQEDPCLFNRYFNIFGLASPNSRSRHDLPPILGVMVDSVYDIIDACREYKPLPDTEYPVAKWNRASIDYSGSPIGKLQIDETDVVPAFSAIHWRSNHHLIVRRIKEGHDSYATMCKTHLFGSLLRDKNIARIIETSDYDALAVIKVILRDDYQSRPPSKKDLIEELEKMHDTKITGDQNHVDAVIQKYPELIGNYKGRKGTPFKLGYFLLSPYDTMLSLRCNGLERWMNRSSTEPRNGGNKDIYKTMVLSILGINDLAGLIEPSAILKEEM